MQKVKNPIIPKVCFWTSPVPLLNITKERTNMEALGSYVASPLRKFSKLDHKMNITSHILYTGN
jgi:hypothetical protein